MPVFAASPSQSHAWWSELRHGGLLISPVVLNEHFPLGVQPPAPYAYRKLRDKFTAFDLWWSNQSNIGRGDISPLHGWLDNVLEDFLEYDRDKWQKGSSIPTEATVATALGDRLRPNRLLYLNGKADHPSLVVWVDRNKRIGVGRGRTAYGKLLEYLRTRGLRLGLLTNGMQFRLCYAGLDYDTWVEWEAGNWFAEGELRQQLDGFYTLLGPPGTTAVDGVAFPLLEAIESSRSRQADLSTVLGEQAREAVELLVDELNRALRKEPALLDIVRKSPSGIGFAQRHVLNALYQACARVIMRLVIVLFAEARGLLPRSLETYNSSYGIEGLYEQLRSAISHEGPAPLEERISAWPRILALFNLVHGGSHHSSLPINAYGGLLFKGGDRLSSDPTLRALALLEDPRVVVTDTTIYQILQNLKKGWIKARHGNRTSWVSGLVDFSDLRTEYIGMVYEGILDYELKSPDETMVILNLGLEPVLQLDILEDMPDKNLKDLLSKLSTEKATVPSTGEESEEEAEEEDELATEVEDADLSEEEEPEEITVEDSEEDETGPVLTKTEEDYRQERAHAWALRAVEVAGWVKKPKGKKKDDFLYYYDLERQKKARNLTKRVIDQGELYLARWGGTRKGSGTFYTKPGLAVPTVHRTLEPLAYEKGGDGKRYPRTPEEILALKVCDPACGSASFLVAALNYLTEALLQSLYFHNRIPPEGASSRVSLPFGNAAGPGLVEELLPVPVEDERFEKMLRARLKRHIVERCIYGVDINPMAVELARLSLWIETMDEELPFGFLDHKIKVGNSLVGCWFDRFQEYPALAWEREGGDKNHSRAVHFKEGTWTKHIKEAFNRRVKPELAKQIVTTGPEKQIPLMAEEGVSPEGLHNEALSIFEELHSLPVSAAGIEKREALYREKLLADTRFQQLKEAFDAWCAVWFWPGDLLENGAPTPDNFYQMAESTKQVSLHLANDLKFFHWELEFPDVFSGENSGFDAVLGNPPWDIQKPNSKEFFSSYDPIYRTYGKQEALQHQTRLFQSDPEIERDWLRYCAHFKAMSNWVKYAAAPFGDPETDGKTITLKRGNENKILHDRWRKRRAEHKGYTDQSHPFAHQGSADLNTYKMFLELSHAILDQGGRLGMVAPSGIYTDKGSTDLRTLFLDHCRWEWLFGFENTKSIFDIHRNYKFCPLIVKKGGTTQAMQTAFMRHDLVDWETPERFSIHYEKARADLFSPVSRSILEVCRQHDLAILEKLYENSVLLGDQSDKRWRIKYATEFHMTNDSKHFPPIDKWLGKGYQPDEYGRWIGPSGEVALPLYEGRMIGQFDFSEKGWVSGKGRGAIWRKLQFYDKSLEPQFLLNEALYRQWPKYIPVLKLVFIDSTTAVHFRTMISAIVPGFPAGNVTPALVVRNNNLTGTLTLAALVNSFVYDFVAKRKCTYLHLSYFVISETPLVKPTDIPSYAEQLLIECAASLNFVHRLFAPYWLQLQRLYPYLSNQLWKSSWAVTEHERLRLRCILDAIVAELYGLDYDDLAWILRNDPTDPKGFWRVDKDKPEELRHTTLSLVAFERLKEVGLEAFCREDWQIPPDSAERLGPRFLPWQLEGTPEESWAECERHAKNILGDQQFSQFMKRLKSRQSEGEKIEGDSASPLRPIPTQIQLWDQGR